MCVYVGKTNITKPDSDIPDNVSTLIKRYAPEVVILPIKKNTEKTSYITLFRSLQNLHPLAIRAIILNLPVWIKAC